MTGKKTYSYFLRFYGKTDEEILACIDAMKAAGSPISRVGPIRPARITANFMLPEGLEPKEVDIFFETADQRESAYDNPIYQGIYHRHSVDPKYMPEMLLRKPKDIAFGV